MEKKECKLYCKKKAFGEAIENKIPEKVKQAIEKAFYKGFLVLFEKGTAVIEKTYDKEKILWQHQFYENRFEQKRKNKGEEKRVDKSFGGNEAKIFRICHKKKKTASAQKKKKKGGKGGGVSPSLNYQGTGGRPVF